MPESLAPGTVRSEFLNIRMPLGIAGSSRLLWCQVNLTWNLFKPRVGPFTVDINFPRWLGACGYLAKIPKGAWLLFAILRFFVGVGLTATVTPSLTVVVEFDADPAWHDRDELLRRLRLRRRFSRSGDLGDDQHRAIRLASRRHAGLPRSTVSRS
jgi:hypothetical protein